MGAKDETEEPASSIESSSHKESTTKDTGSKHSSGGINGFINISNSPVKLKKKRTLVTSLVTMETANSRQPGARP